MRNTVLFFGLGGCALLATAVLAADVQTPPTTTKKKDDGPGMTLNQKVSSLFGLIDRGSPTPPPTPPGMPPMNAHGPVRVTNGQNSRSQNSSGGSARTFQPSANGPGGIARDPSLPQPPQPMRIADGSAVAGDEPRALPASAGGAAKPATQQRQSIVGASKMPLFPTPSNTAGDAKMTAGATTKSNNGAKTWTASGNAANTAKAPNAVTTSAKSTPAGDAANLSAATKPFVSSRRKPTTEDTATDSNTGTSAAPSLLAAPEAAPNVAIETAPIGTIEVEPAMPVVPSLINDAPSREPAPVASSQVPVMLPPAAVQAPPTPPRPQTTINAAVGPTTTGDAARGDVLVSYTNPELTVDTVGPRKISIGRESNYRVVVRNQGNIEARDVLVSLQAPEHAEIVGLRGTSGHSTSAEEFAAGTPLEWRLDRLPPRTQEELTISLIPRRSESFELGVRWTSSSPVSRAIVEVEEPKLALAITGPSEVAFGEQRLFKLTVSNPGTGTADNVILHLMPLSPNDGEPVRHTVGTLKPGESSVVEVELTARQAGALRIRTEAMGEGNLRAEAAADVVVRRALLDVAAVAPRVLFAGVPGTYEFRVRNTGDDAARNVRVSVDLPTGVKLLSAVPPTAGGKSNQLVWTFDRIAPGSEQVCSLKCAWDQGGKQQLTITAVAAGDIQKSAIAATDVQAVADLALDVADTAGPIPVGRPVTYEIRVKNRGLKAAEGVDVVAYFSEGIEPDRAEGQGYEMQPGMAIFKTLATVGPGQEKVLKVTARAQTAGNHRIRVEMQSAAPQTQLSHEDATFFYVDETVDPKAEQTSPPASFKPQGASPIRPTASTEAPDARPPVTNAVPSNRVNTIR